MKKTNLNKVIVYIHHLMKGVQHHKPTHMHYFRLVERLQDGKKLTKKMRENLTWILRDLGMKDEL